MVTWFIALALLVLALLGYLKTVAVLTQYDFWLAAAAAALTADRHPGQRPLIQPRPRGGCKRIAREAVPLQVQWGAAPSRYSGGQELRSGRGKSSI